MTEWSYTVKMWAIRKRPYRKPYQLRWQVGIRPHSESFLTLGLAESRRAQLITAARAGEPFDVDSGLPRSLMQRDKDIPWYQHARNYIELKWDPSPATTRKTLAEAMATVTMALVKDTKGMAETKVARRVLYSWAFNVHRWDEEQPDEVKAVLAWFERKSLPVSALSERMVARKALNACTKKLDGTMSAGTVITRKRAIFHQALEYAVDAELLSENPLHSLQWTSPEKVDDELDRACVPGPELAEQLLAGVRSQGPRGRHLEAFFACILYAAARPGETVGLQASDFHLPRRGWGRCGCGKAGRVPAGPGRTPARRTIGRGSSTGRAGPYGRSRSRRSSCHCCGGTSRSTVSRRTGGSSERLAAAWCRRAGTGRCGRRPGPRFSARRIRPPNWRNARMTFATQRCQPG
ncbi:hypothetical protein ACFQFR_21345 [Streptomyces goshikiensis]